MVDIVNLIADYWLIISTNLAKLIFMSTETTLITSNPVNVPAHLLPQRVRHANPLRRVRVLRVGRPTPGVVSVTLGGEALRDFVSAGFDDHLKLMLPPALGRPLVLPTLQDGRVSWPADLSETDRPVMRDYTPLHFDAQALELDLEFALHGEGPAAAWAANARPGDEVGLGGPRGSMVVPAGHDAYVLAGDESALPAIARRLAELPAGTRALALIEVATADEQRALASAAQVNLRWLVRGTAAPGQRLLEAVRATPLPEGLCFAWAAGEALTMAELRAHWLGLGQPAALMRVSAYWR